MKADRFQRLAFDVGVMILMVGILHLPPMITAGFTTDQVALDAFLASLTLSVLLGGALALGFRGGRSKHRQDQLIVMPFCLYLAASVFGSLPFFFQSPDIKAVPAFYEGVSLVTTSGASVFYTSGVYTTAFEVWRSMLAWLGGFMALLLVIGVMVPMNAGGYRLHISTMVMEHGEGLEDRLLSAAKLLFPIYTAFTWLIIMGLTLLGTPFFDAFQIASGLVSLTGYPIEGVNNLSSLQIVAISLLLLIAALNWDNLVASFKYNRWRWLKDPETKGIFLNLGIAVLLLWLILPMPVIERILDAFSLAVSAVTTSGWRYGDEPALVSDVVVMATLGFAIVGGAALSASGGIKQLRGIALRQVIGSELDRLAHPNKVMHVTLGRARVEDADKESLWLFITLMIGMLVLSILLLMALGLDMASAVYNTLGHITLSAPLVDHPGLGFDRVSNFYDLELLTLSVVLIVARVDACIFLVILGRKFWKI